MDHGLGKWRSGVEMTVDLKRGTVMFGFGVQFSHIDHVNLGLFSESFIPRHCFMSHTNVSSNSRKGGKAKQHNRQNSTD